MTAVILHGICDEEEYFHMEFPSPSNAHWIPWLQQKFLRSGILCQTLEMPKPYAPKYEEWAENFKQLDIEKISHVVAHSAGCGFILKYLSKNQNIELEKLTLVAPWLDLKGTIPKFLECSLDKHIQKRIKNLNILYAKNERVQGVEEAKNLIMSIYPKSTLYLFSNKGHFCLSDLQSPEFPKLWEICKP